MESPACRKATPSPSYQAVCGILYILVLCGSSCVIPVASSPDGSCGLANVPVENSVGCMPFSQKYLTGYYTEKHNALPGNDFRDFLAYESCQNCEQLPHNISDMIGFSKLHRLLIGEGSHRRLTSAMTFHIQLDTMSWFDSHSCDATIIERLPVGVFADPFELQHLVQRQVYLDAAVFGDTNLELPSALSSRSVVEIHVDFEHVDLSKGSELVVELPLHARYPPLDASGYARVEMGTPDIFLCCRPKSSKHESFDWTVGNLNVGSAKNVFWLVPCGDEGHTRFVSLGTFVSALFSALLLVFSAVYFPTIEVKNL